MNVCKICIMQKGLKGDDVFAGKCDYTFETEDGLIQHFAEVHKLVVQYRIKRDIHCALIKAVTKKADLMTTGHLKKGEILWFVNFPKEFPKNIELRREKEKDIKYQVGRDDVEVI